MTPLVALFGIQLPVLQAPMAGVQGAAMAAAVSNAGGLGGLPCAMLSAAGLRSELELLTAASAAPYNVNFFCHTPAAEDPHREAAWRAALHPYYREYGLDPAAIPAVAERTPFSRVLADVLADFRPPVVSFHFGLPADELIACVRSWGAKIIASATTVDEARWLAARGVDAVIAQGADAGGHRGAFLSDGVSGQLGTLELLPQVIRAVRVPVIAAGGIADAADVKTALDLGAGAVQVGTSYLLCAEATTSPVHRGALDDPAAETVLTNVFTGRPARAIVNRLIRELGPMTTLAPGFPRATAAVAPLRAAAEAQGRGDFSPLWSGTNRRGCRPVSAALVTRDLAARVT